MSLIVDPDYLIYSLRLAYLRHIDDTHGARVLSFPNVVSGRGTATARANGANADEAVASSERNASPETERAAFLDTDGADAALPSDSHVALAGLNDAKRYPELLSCHSPKPLVPELRAGNASFDVRSIRQPSGGSSTGGSGTTDAHQLWRTGDGRIVAAAAPAAGPSEDGVTPAGPGGLARVGSGLKYTQTIYGPGRTGALGMRVSGRRASGVRPTRRGSSASSMDESTGQLSVGKEGVDRAGWHIPQLEVSLATADRAPGREAERMGRRGSNPVPGAVAETSQSDNGARMAGGARVAATAAVGSPPALVSPRERSSSDAEVGRAVGNGPDHVGLSAFLGRGRRRSASDGASDVLRASNGSIETIRGPRPPPVEESGGGDGLASWTRGPEPVGVVGGGARSTGSTDAQGGRVAHYSEKERTGVVPLSSLGRLRTRPADRWMLAEPRKESGLVRHPQHIFTPVTELEEPVFPTSATTPVDPSARPPALQEAPFEDGRADEAKDVDTPGVGPRKTPRETSSWSPSASRDEGADAQPSSFTSDARASFSGTDTRNPGDEESLRHPTGSLGFESGQSTDALHQAGGMTEPDGGSATGVEETRPTEATAVGRGGDDRQPQPQQRGNSKGAQKPRRARRKPKDRVEETNAWFRALRADPATVAQRLAQRPKVSALSALLQQQNELPENPFAREYAGVSGRAASSSDGAIEIEMYFPFARCDAKVGSEKVATKSGAVSVDAASKSMRLRVRKDATMEELTGYALYCYAEEGWEPALADGAVTDEELDVRLSTLGWTVRIVEDGEVDDDYPAIDRTLKVGNFGADELAVCPATDAQVQQHRAAPGFVSRAREVANASLGAEITAAPSGVGASTTITTPVPSAGGLRVGPLLPPPPPPPPASQLPNTGPAARLAATTMAPPGSLINIAGTPIFASSALSRSMHGASRTGIFLRVLVTPNAAVRYKTTLQVPSDMYLADVLETICRKRNLLPADEWALVVPERDIVVPLDRTVESLQGNHDLALVRRSTLGAQGGAGALTGQSTNPKASIFKRLSEPAQPRYPKTKDPLSTYKSYVVNRKMPMFGGKQDSNLVLDGEWLHIIPTDARAFHAHAASFPISSVVSCKLSSRTPSHFRVIISREATAAGQQPDPKRYDFEAENNRQAAEIVMEINMLRNAAVGR